MTKRETVWVTASSSGVYHTERDCDALQRAANVRVADRDAQQGRRSECKRCSGRTQGTRKDAPWRWNDAGQDEEEVAGGD